MCKTDSARGVCAAHRRWVCILSTTTSAAGEGFKLLYAGCKCGATCTRLGRAQAGGARGRLPTHGPVEALRECTYFSKDCETRSAHLMM